MKQLDQQTRPVKLHTPLGEHAFVVASYEGEESVSAPFRYRVELQAADSQIDFQRLVGKGVCLEIARAGHQPRLLHGVVAEFAQTGIDASGSFYTAELRPWFWLLTMNAGCRIFQNRTTPEIVKEVFRGLGFADVTDRLRGSYAAREYCVQYSETAFDFVSRLLEEEGIAYFFEHEAGAHKMVLTDEASGWHATAGSIRVAGPEAGWTSDEAIERCVLEQRITVGEVATTDYNFETPLTTLYAHTSSRQAARSVFHYPGLHRVQHDGEVRTGHRLEAHEARGRMLRGQSSCRGLMAGARFSVNGHPRADANTEYFVERLTVRGAQTTYTNSFEAIPVATRYRPPWRTRRPFIAGTQTAVVTGKSGEEIWTDAYGRVKVKFHWDQAAGKNENSSCWIRVAQGWAGKNWGSFFLPRIGQEVVVSFLEGNPDRPLVSGCVYNADQTTPYPLPSAQTQSTIKTRSTPGGAGWNELRFEDKAGHEEVYLRAQKDMKEEVLGARAVTVGGAEKHDVTGSRTLDVQGDEKHTSHADYTLKVSGNLVIEAGGSVTIKAGSNLEQSAGANLTSKAGANLEQKAGANITSKAGAEHTVEGGALVVVKGGLVKIN